MDTWVESRTSGGLEKGSLRISHTWISGFHTHGSHLFSGHVSLVTQSCQTFFTPMDCGPPGSSVHGDSVDQNTGVGCHALLQRISRIRGSSGYTTGEMRIFVHLLKDSVKLSDIR